METSKKPTDSFNFSQINEIIGLCIAKWYWFAISLGVCLFIAAYKIITTVPVYTRTATVLIKESTVRRSTSSDLDMVMSSAGAASTSSKLVNEIVAFQSPELMKNVVTRLKLDIDYSVSGKTHKNTFFGVEVPIEAIFPGEPTQLNQSCSFVVTPGQADSFSISKLVYFDKKKKIKSKEVITASYGDTLNTEIGKVLIVRRPMCQNEFKKPINVRKIPKASAVTMMLRRFSAQEVDLKNKSDVLTLTMKDVNIARADNVLMTLINIYNENWVSDKNKMAISTSAFITERLAALKEELTQVDQNISEFKSRNLIPDLKSVSNMYMAQGAEMTQGIRKLENDLYVARYLKNYMRNSLTDNDLIPMPAGITDVGIAQQIESYNNLVLNKKILEENSSDDNPVVKDIVITIVAMRSAIIASIDNLEKTIQAQVDYMRGQVNVNSSRIAESPTQAQYLMSIERDLNVKDGLYMFLLKKREENELSQAFTAYNTRVITPPYGSNVPSSPQKQKILIIALFFGLLIPSVILYFKEITNTTVRGRSDVDQLSVPFLGEIPQDVAPGDKKLKGLKFWEKPVTKRSIVVKEGKRDVINEAFRVLRTNLEFTLKGKEHSVILLTSFNPGSGKTFLTANLAYTLSIKKRKILLIDGDMRHASLSAFVDSPKLGLSNYLAGQTDDIDALIIKDSMHKNLDIIPVGTIPPNPSELVSDERFVSLIGDVRQKYDIVFIDCPPVDIVADTQIISEVADRTIFVVRAGLLERSMLPNIQELCNEQRYKNMTIVLNGTTSSGKYAGKFAYNNGYYGYYNSSYYHQ